MRITLTVPDWVDTDGHNLYLMSGVETVAIRYPGKPWIVKKGRCSRCGNCCVGFDLAKNSLELEVGKIAYDTTEGKCLHLISDGPTMRICALGMDRPWSCCVVECTLPGCTQTYETMK